MGDDTKNVKVGDLIALMVSEGEDWTDVQIPGKKIVTPELKKESKTLIETKPISGPVTQYS